MFSKFLPVVFLSILCSQSIPVLTQTIFFEPFTEPADAITGLDDEGGVSWMTSCPTCLDGADYFKVVSGKLEGQDTNGPATWTSETIDISSCDFIEISFDLSEVGTMEACGTGCNSTDWVQFEYNIDGGGWESPADATYCPGACADVMVIQSDDIPGGARLYETGCIDGGETIQVRITVQAWAASEKWQIDNFRIGCASGPEVDAGEDLMVCEGTPVILTADNPEDAVLTWDHDITDGEEFTPPVGIEDYIVEADDGTCIAKDTVWVEVLPDIEIEISPAGPFTLSDGIQILTATPDDGIWSADCGACIDAVTGEFDPVVAGVGDWEVCYTAGIEPCDEVECITISVTDDCDLEGFITLTHPTCSDLSNGEIEVIVEGEVGPVIYSIFNVDGLLVNEDNANIAEALEEGWYFIEITDEYPCLYTDSAFIESPDPIEFDLVISPPLCAEELGTASIDTVTNYGGEFDLISYHWLPMDVEGFGLNEMTDLEDGFYTVIVTDEFGCHLATSFEIDSPEPLILTSLEIDSISCAGENDASIEINVLGGTPPYLYALNDGTFSPIATFSDLGAGEYEIEILDANGCSIDTSFILIDPLGLTIEFDVTAETCEMLCDGEIEITASGGTSPYEYSIDDCASLFPTGIFTGLCPADYTICVTDANSCSISDVVTVNNGLPVLNGTIYPPTLICENDPPFLIDAANIGLLTGPGVIDGVFNPKQAGIGNHTILNSFDGVCSSTTTSTFTVNAIPFVDFTISDSMGCAPLEISFFNIGDIGTTCEWSFGDGSSETACGSVTHTYSNPETFDVSLEIEDAVGCSNITSEAALINILNQPIANFNYAPTQLTTLETNVQFTDASTDATNWEWTFDNLADSKAKNPTYKFPETAGEYDVYLLVSNEFGCFDQTKQTIIISEDYSVFIPNAFTPDGDGLNSVFKPYFNGINIYNYNLLIYNRWGEQVFQSYDPSIGWNGSYGDDLVAPGVYIYHIVTSEIDSDKKLEYHGHITVLR